MHTKPKYNRGFIKWSTDGFAYYKAVGCVITDKANKDDSVQKSYRKILITFNNYIILPTVNLFSHCWWIKVVFIISCKFVQTKK